MKPPALLLLSHTALLAVLALAGCAGREAYRARPVPAFLPAVGEKASVPAPSPAVPGQPAALREIGLGQAVQQALEADPKIQAGLESVRQTEADLVTAGLLPNPTFSSGGSLMPLNRAYTPTRQGGPPQFDAGLAFPIDGFLFGKRAAAIVAAQQGVDVATAEFADLVRQRLAGTVAAFFDVLEAQALRELAEEDLRSLSLVERITANRVALGDVGSIELDRIRLSIFSSRRELRAREAALAAAFSRFRAFLGLADGAPLRLAGTLDAGQPAEPLAGEAAMAIAEENRPDLIALRRQVEKAAADLRVEERKALPEVTPHVGYTRQFQEKAIGYPDVNGWGVGVDLTLPLFDRNQGNIAKARSLHVQSALNVDARLVDLRAEIEQAVQAYQTAYQVLTSDDPGQLDAARNVRDKIRTAYELGGKSLMEVLDAQRAYRETFRLHITGRSGYWHALYGLNAALGKQVLQ
jgi:cobalt-zinc-cadmium efflux system outer membrane protein